MSIVMVARRMIQRAPVRVGDVVLVHDDSSPRGFWKLGRIRSLVVGRDGRTRGAVLRVVATGLRESTLQRPLQRLYPLETGNLSPGKEEETNKENGVSTNEGEEDCDPLSARSEIVEETCGSNRPKREAAQRSRDRALTIALSEQEDYSD